MLQIWIILLNNTVHSADTSSQLQETQKKEVIFIPFCKRETQILLTRISDLHMSNVSKNYVLENDQGVFCL